MITAFVMTAGLGTRLDPLTRLVAKPAVPLGPRTLIEEILAGLAGHGVRDAILNLHHLPHTLTRVVGDGLHLGLRVRYSWESPLLGSAGGPRLALPLIGSDPIVIVNGDTLCDVDLAAMLDAHAATRADVTMAVVPNPAPDHYNGLVVNADDEVTAVKPRGTADGTWHFVGVQIVNTRVLAPCPIGVPLETVSGIYRERLARGAAGIRVFRARRFLDVGTPRDYLDAALRRARDAGMAAAADDVIIWPEARVESGASLSRAIVAGAVTVPAGFCGHDVVVVPAAVARAGDDAQVRGELAVFPLGR